VDLARLQAAAGSLGVPLDDSQADRLIRYVALLERWNAKFNLISRQDIARIWPRHILDSLSIAPLLTTNPASPEKTQLGLTALDIGTGAGLPGLPLAIALPAFSWRLIDRNQRKVRFLETVISQIGLENVTARAIDLGAESDDEFLRAADFVVSRAVDEPARLLPMAEPLLKPAGRLVLMTAVDKGGPDYSAGDGDDSDETDSETLKRPMELPAGCGFIVTEVRELTIPGLDRTHEATIIDRERPTPGA